MLLTFLSGDFCVICRENATHVADHADIGNRVISQEVNRVIGCVIVRHPNHGPVRDIIHVGDHVQGPGDILTVIVLNRV